MLPRISVIVTVYNIQAYLPQCIESLVDQSYTELEILLVDDGSTDGSGELCDVWAERDRRIRALHRPNGGLSAARNTGLEYATGDYIAFVDGDDHVDKEMYRCLIETAQKYSADVVMSSICALKEDGRRFMVFENAFSERQIIDHDEVMRLLIFEKEISTSACNKLFKHRLFATVRFPEGKIYEDKAVMHKILHLCETIAIDKRAIYYYLLRDNSITKVSFSEKNFDQLEAAQNRYEFYQKYYPELATDVKANLCEQAMVQTIIAFKGHASREQFRRLDRWMSNSKEAYYKSRSIPWTGKLEMLLKYHVTRVAAFVRPQ